MSKKFITNVIFSVILVFIISNLLFNYPRTDFQCPPNAFCEGNILIIIAKILKWFSAFLFALIYVSYEIMFIAKKESSILKTILAVIFGVYLFSTILLFWDLAVNSSGL